MTIVRVGATKKYADGWETAFAKGKKKAEPVAAAKKASAKPKTTKTSAKRKSGAKPGKKK